MVDATLVEDAIVNELSPQKSIMDVGRYEAYERAANLMRELVLAPQFIDFLTLQAYEWVLNDENLVTV